LLKKHVRLSKYDPLVEQVELVHATPHYAHVRFPSGREATVSTRDIAPVGDSAATPASNVDCHSPAVSQGSSPAPRSGPDPGVEAAVEDGGQVNESSESGDGVMPDPSHDVSESLSRPPEQLPLRRSTRQRKPVERYDGGTW